MFSKGFRTVYLLVTVLLLASCQLNQKNKKYDSFESESEIPVPYQDSGRLRNGPFSIHVSFCGNRLKYNYLGYIDTQVRLIPHQGSCLGITTSPGQDYCDFIVDPRVELTLEFTRKGQAPQTVVLKDNGCEYEEISF